VHLLIQKKVPLISGFVNEAGDGPAGLRLPFRVFIEPVLRSAKFRRRALRAGFECEAPPYPPRAWRSMRLTAAGSSKRNVTGRVTTARA
jgi:hypothetical protein